MAARAPTDREWGELLLRHTPNPPLRAKRLLQAEIALSFSRPSIYLAEDDEEYVVKLPRHNRESCRALASEQAVANAAALIDAPVPFATTIEIEEVFLPPAEDASSAGIAHASRYVPDLSDLDTINHVDENRGRFAALAVLYTWTRGADHQVCYETGPARLVWSVDHGMFLPPANDWTADSLARQAPPASIDPWFEACGLSSSDLESSLQKLRSVTPADVAQVAASARAVWGISDPERLALCRFLWCRRAATLYALSAQP